MIGNLTVTCQERDGGLSRMVGSGLTFRSKLSSDVLKAIEKKESRRATSSEQELT
jgi:hypothetical protein